MSPAKRPALTALPLASRVVLITGAASGIGAATAMEVVAQGGIPVLVDCDEEPLAHMAQCCGPDTLYSVSYTHLTLPTKRIV